MANNTVSCAQKIMEEKTPSDEEAVLTENLILEIANEFDIRLRNDPAKGRVYTDGTGDDAESDEILLSSMWSSVRGPMKDLVTIIFNFLRNLDAQDVANAANIVRASYGQKREILIAVLQFISVKLDKIAAGGRQEYFEYAPKKAEK